MHIYKSGCVELNRRSKLIAYTIMAATSLSYASTSTEYLEKALRGLCADIQGLVPVTAMLLVVSAGVIYSAGQMFGAETRARANVWATSCLTGAVIGVIIATVAPCVLATIADVPCSDFQCS